MLKNLSTFCTVLLLGMLFSVSLMARQPVPAVPSIDKHAQTGVACARCHTEAPPAKAVSFQKCQSCHGDNEAMGKISEKKVDPDPHYSHLGAVGCTECHKNHNESVLLCNECHKFDLKTP